MKGIVARNQLGYIGLSGHLPWSCKEDLEHFKKLTMGSTLLVGYKTSKTLPDLPGRTVIIDDEDKKIDISKIDWCIGGKYTYEKYCHLFTELHISIIDDYSLGDVRYPRLNNLSPLCKIFTYGFSKDE